jgi:signal transduction histidine kinase/CheY-like chemotaxis protein
MGVALDLAGRRKDGSEFPVQVSLGPLRADGGLLVLGIVRDITEQKKLEEQLRQSQKMEAVGRLAGGVAHDFNNLLTIINGYAEMVLHDLPPDDPAAVPIREIHAAGERAAALTRQLLAFSRRQVLSPQVLDLNALVADMGKMLRRLIGEDVLLEHVAGPSPPVLADRGQLEQVVLNLAVNARDAMPGGGRLTLSTAPLVVDETCPAPHPGVPAGSYAVLTVADTGYGMHPQTLARIFEPFFTTKEVGKGTGLGLAMVYGIIKQSGGFIYAASAPGRGATFTIYLPATEPVRSQGGPETDMAVVARGTETILLVEDEEAVRGMTREALQLCGYTILDASQGVEALRLCAEHAGPLHLVLTDVVMPEMGGPELVRRLTASRPDLKVLFMTGYTTDSTLRGLSPHAAPVLHKPFTLRDLSRIVRQVLDEK